MYRVVKLTNVLYALEIDDIESDLENIECFLSTDDPVILCQSLEDLKRFDIDIDDIKIVEKE